MARVAMPKLKRTPKNPEGRMSLTEHLKELRRRVLIAATAIVLLAVVGWIEYDPLFEAFSAPIANFAAERGRGVESFVNFSGITDPFSLHLSVALFVGFILASPVWLYQTWAFIVPGLTKKEKRTALAFLGAALPLFLVGCLLAYLTLPHAISALLSFTPSTAGNIMPATEYLSFVLKFILAFGLAFLLPVFLVGLNAIGILPGRVLIKAWRMAVFLIFLFAAIMTPTPDAFTMIALALPMVGLFFLAVGICFLHDRRRAARKATETSEWADLADDEASRL